jgi:uncharacterized protein YyaL (SSP411 family)
MNVVVMRKIPLKRRSRANRLILEKSPYLLQHSHNPVDWYPWGDEAFQKAQAEDKPVFLSIGYSTCHWCHVMEKESFEDSEVARMLNDTFVCIKVDREERPDLDAVFMKISQTITGTGGWPLHIVMTADKKPFFAATYLPKERIFGKPGIVEIIQQIKRMWTSKRNELVNSAEKITALLRNSEKESENMQPIEELAESTLDEAYTHLLDDFDETHGGFDFAPKFPAPHRLCFLLRYWKRTQNDKALQMVEKTLTEMRLGGICDHLSFGFHRYSTDANWLVPHFEKMLYDQAMLVTTYVEAYQATGKEEYKQTVREVISYVMQDMTDPLGGFYTAEDADSEEEEGKYYLWTEEEIEETLSPKEAEFIKKIFNIEKEGNFVDVAIGRRNGKNVLYLKKPVDEQATDLGFSPAKLKSEIEEIRKKLSIFRAKRVHPSKDDKILTDWNGLMILALAKASQALHEPEYAVAARKAADFMIERLIDKEGRLLHCYRQGEAKIQGFLDDYAFFIWGLKELYEAVLDAKYLRYAIDLTEDMLAHFWDQEHGGFYSTADCSEIVLERSKDIYDGAYPSGNSVAALVLLFLGRMTGTIEFEQKASELMRAFSIKVARSPSAYAQLMVALDFALGPSSEVVIVGDLHEKDTDEFLRTIRSRFLPRKVVLFRSSVDQSPEIAELASFIKNLQREHARATAFVCRNHVCNIPTTNASKMLEMLEQQ